MVLVHFSGGWLARFSPEAGKLLSKFERIFPAAGELAVLVLVGRFEHSVVAATWTTWKHQKPKMALQLSTSTSWGSWGWTRPAKTSQDLTTTEAELDNRPYSKS